MIAGQSEIKRNIMLTEVKGNWWMQSRLMKVNKLKKYIKSINDVTKSEIWIIWQDINDVMKILMK